MITERCASVRRARCEAALLPLSFAALFAACSITPCPAGTKPDKQRDLCETLEGPAAQDNDATLQTASALDTGTAMIIDSHRDTTMDAGHLDLLDATTEPAEESSIPPPSPPETADPPSCVQKLMAGLERKGCFAHGRRVQIAVRRMDARWVAYADGFMQRNASGDAQTSSSVTMVFSDRISEECTAAPQSFARDMPDFAQISINASTGALTFSNESWDFVEVRLPVTCSGDVILAHGPEHSYSMSFGDLQLPESIACDADETRSAEPDDDVADAATAPTATDAPPANPEDTRLDGGNAQPDASIETATPPCIAMLMNGLGGTGCFATARPVQLVIHNREQGWVSYTSALLRRNAMGDAETEIAAETFSDRIGECGGGEPQRFPEDDADEQQLMINAATGALRLTKRTWDFTIVLPTVECSGSMIVASDAESLYTLIFSSLQPLDKTCDLAAPDAG